MQDEPDISVTSSSEAAPLVITPADSAAAVRQVQAASRGVVPAGITLYRAAAVNDHPEFIAALTDVVRRAMRAAA